jgi:hypothetical protein
MEYIYVQNNVVTELVSCSESPGDGWVEVDLSGGVFVGADVRAYDSDWNLRPMQELVELGLISLEREKSGGAYPEGTVLQKVIGNSVVAKTRFDFVKEGVAQLGALEYLDEESQTIKSAETIEEMLELGLVTQEIATEKKAQEVRKQRDRLLGIMDAVVINPLRWNTLTESQRQELAIYRQALLDVPQQPGFPWSAEWPESPV